MAPEVIAAGPKPKFDVCNFSSKVDVWSLGLILLEAYLVSFPSVHFVKLIFFSQETILWNKLGAIKTMEKILSYLKFG